MHRPVSSACETYKAYQISYLILNPRSWNIHADRPGAMTVILVPDRWRYIGNWRTRYVYIAPIGVRR